MEALGDAVVTREAPHADDLLTPGIQSLTELDQLREDLAASEAELKERVPAVMYQNTLRSWEHMDVECQAARRRAYVARGIAVLEAVAIVLLAGWLWLR